LKVRQNSYLATPRLRRDWKATKKAGKKGKKGKKKKR